MKSFFKLVIGALSLATAGAYEGEDRGLPDGEYCKKKSSFVGSQNRILLQSYHEGADSLYYMSRPISKHLRFLTGDRYRKDVVDDDGKYVAKTPYFITFVRMSQKAAEQNAEPLRTLAQKFEGKVQFAYIDFHCDEHLRMAYDVYNQTRHYYIDTDGRAYAYPNPLIGSNSTSEWIEERKFRQSPFQFQAPSIASDNKLIWLNIKKEVRTWYDNNLRDQIEPHLRKVGFTYVVDMDPTDFDNVKFNQKRDRQILFILSAICMVLEGIWDMMSAPPAGTKVKKRSVLSSSQDDVAPPAKEKVRREKIE